MTGWGELSLICWLLHALFWRVASNKSWGEMQGWVVSLRHFISFHFFGCIVRHVGLWDLINSSPSRDWTHTPCSGSTGLPGQSLTTLFSTFRHFLSVNSSSFQKPKCGLLGVPSAPSVLKLQPCRLCHCYTTESIDYIEGPAIFTYSTELFICARVLTALPPPMYFLNHLLFRIWSIWILFR